VTKKDVVQRITELLEPTATARGFELVAVEQAGGRGTPVLRVLLDCEGGITLDAVASANEWVSALLDEEDPFNGPYTLEISSPGVDRPLVKREDYARFAGETVNLKVTTGDKRKSWTGVLLGIEGDQIALDVEGERVVVAFDTVQKARLRGVVDFGKGRGAV